MSETQVESDHDEFVLDFIEQFNAVEGYDLRNEIFQQSDIWVNQEHTIALVPHDVERFGIVPIEDTEQPDYVERYETKLAELVEVGNNEDENYYSYEYIDDILDLIDREFEYLESNGHTKFGEDWGHLLFIEYEDWYIVVAPRIVN